MSKHFVQNALLRRTLISGYRAYARSQIWRTGPRIFINSIPKAGTHLLTAELDKFREIRNSRLHIETREVNAAAVGGGRVEEIRIDAALFADRARTVRRGQFFSGHLFWDETLAAFLRDANIRTVFVKRDPRDILVSQLHYIVGLRRHYLHRLIGGLRNDEERLRMLVLGRVGEPFIRPLREQLARFIPWTSAEFVLDVRFEDLVGERGGGSMERKRETLLRICHHCGLPTDRIEEFSRAAAKATPTLRAGRANAWQAGLPDSIVRLVTEHCAEEIARLGYPID